MPKSRWDPDLLYSKFLKPLEKAITPAEKKLDCDGCQDPIQGAVWFSYSVKEHKFCHDNVTCQDTLGSVHDILDVNYRFDFIDQAKINELKDLYKKSNKGEFVRVVREVWLQAPTYAMEDLEPEDVL